MKFLKVLYVRGYDSMRNTILNKKLLILLKYKLILI